MKWFDKWFYNQSQKAWHNHAKYEREKEMDKNNKLAMNVPTKAYADNIAYDRGDQSQFGNAFHLKMNVYPADGGIILEFRHYDPTHGWKSNLHIVNEGEKQDEKISAAITMELMKVKQ